MLLEYKNGKWHEPTELTSVENKPALPDNEHPYPPSLQNTQLFTEEATGCQEVDLERWHHPVQAVFSHMGVSLRKLQLCNNNKYPLFYIGTLPPGPPLFGFDDYYKSLFSKMRVPNGNWPFSFIDTERGIIINVNYNDMHEAKACIEYFQAVSD